MKGENQMVEVLIDDSVYNDLTEQEVEEIAYLAQPLYEEE